MFTLPVRNKAVLTFPLTPKRCFPRHSVLCSFVAEISYLCSTELLVEAAADRRGVITPCIQPRWCWSPKASQGLGTWEKKNKHPSLAHMINILFRVPFEF